MGLDVGMTSVIGIIEGDLKTQDAYHFYEFTFQKETRGRIINIQKANNSSIKYFFNNYPSDTYQYNR